MHMNVTFTVSFVGIVNIENVKIETRAHGLIALGTVYVDHSGEGRTYSGTICVEYGIIIQGGLHAKEALVIIILALSSRSWSCSSF